MGRETGQEQAEEKPGKKTEGVAGLCSGYTTSAMLQKQRVSEATEMSHMMKTKKKNPLNLTITEVSDHSYGISFFSPSPEDIFFSRCLYSERKGRERDIHDRET